MISIFLKDRKKAGLKRPLVKSVKVTYGDKKKSSKYSKASVVKP